MRTCAIFPISVALLSRFLPGKCLPVGSASSLSILLLVCTPRSHPCPQTIQYTPLSARYTYSYSLPDSSFLV